MNIDLMRKVDKYVGIPLTFFCTVAMKFASLFHTVQPSRPSRILFIELSEMGSTILADPAMRKAQSHFTAELFFVIFQKNRPSLSLLKTIPPENIFTLREANMLSLVRDILLFFFWCRKNKIDTTVDLELFSRISALLTWFSGAQNRVGFYAYHSEGLYRGNMLTHKVSYNPYMHITKNYISLVSSLMAAKEEKPYSKIYIDDKEMALTIIDHPEHEKETIFKRIKKQYPSLTKSDRLVLINPNSSELLPQRRWMPQNYIALIKMILGQWSDCLVLITGAPGEEKGSRHIIGQVAQERCIDVTGKFILEELPLLYSISALMVTNDSGPGHFSAITRMPCVVLFGPETPKMYGSLGNSFPIYAELACSPCVSAANHRKTTCMDNVCLQVITTQMVFETLTAILEKSDNESSPD